MRDSRRWLAALVAMLCSMPVDVRVERSAQPSRTWQDPSPHRVRSVTVDTSVRLEVLDWGGTGPPLVLLGCYLSAHAYDDFAPKLTGQFHVYGLTRRGIGASDTPADGYAVQRSVDDLREVLDELRIDRSIVLGTSCAGQGRRFRKASCARRSRPTRTARSVRRSCRRRSDARSRSTLA